MSWLWTLLLNLALKFGVPWVLAKFPWIPPALREILERLIGTVSQVQQTKKEAVKLAKAEWREVRKQKSVA